MGTSLLYSGHRAFHVPDIIQGIKDPEDIYPVFMGKVNKPIDHIIRIVPVSDQVLPTQKHLYWRVF